MKKGWQKETPISFLRIIDPQSSIVFLNYDPVIYALSEKFKSKEDEVRKVIETELPAFVANVVSRLGVESTEMVVISVLNLTINRIVNLLEGEEYR